MFILPLKATNQQFLVCAKLYKSSPNSQVLPVLRMLSVAVGTSLSSGALEFWDRLTKRSQPGTSVFYTDHLHLLGFVFLFSFGFLYYSFFFPNFFFFLFLFFLFIFFLF